MFASGKTAAVASAANYIEDVFSTYLYTGNGSTQTITNGIDLSTKGGLVWYKDRTTAYEHEWVDTARGAGYNLESPNTTASTSRPTALTAFNTTGFTLGSNVAANGSGDNFVSWTFRKQPKFFDVVTYTGTGSNTTISHSLGSVPACIMVKRTDTTGDWQVYHSSLANTEYLVLNTTAAKATGATRWNSTTPTSTVFSIGTDATVNASGGTYVAYLFAHNAGGFGLTGTDNVISCGSFTTNGSGVASVTLDYEPQFVLVKRTDSTSDWFMMDNMRGLTADPNNPVAMLRANLSNAENTASYTGWSINATGFGWSAGAASATYIYIAIRRGPMKVPTSGTSVFNVQSATAGTSHNVGFPPDLVLNKDQASGSYPFNWGTRLQGNDKRLQSATTNGELTGSGYWKFDDKTNYFTNTVTATGYDWSFQRAPSFFDEVCYTGTGSATTFSHNLGVTPELMIVKARTNLSGSTQRWRVYSATLGATKNLVLDLDQASGTYSGYWNNTAPTSTVFSVGTDPNVNWSGDTYVAYLFATCAGVSKCGSYTGTGTTLQVNCGFTGGARFVLIKRTDSTGDWYVWDTARGIVSGNDPYLLLNSTAAEVTNTDYVDTYSAGFEISSTAPAAINANGGTFIFLAIA